MNEKHVEYNNKLFKPISSFYDILAVLISPLRTEIIETIPQKSKVLDVACGTGTLSIALAKVGHKVIGIDLSPELVYNPAHTFLL